MKAVKMSPSVRLSKTSAPKYLTSSMIRTNNKLNTNRFQNHTNMLNPSNLVRVPSLSSTILNQSLSKRFYATTSGAVLKANDDNFEEVVVNGSKQQPILVDCYADWCGPCRVLGPKLEALVAATNGAVKLAVVDVDENGEVASKLRVTSIPAVFAYHQGKVVDSFVGLLSDSNLNQFVQDIKSLKK
mmetsp:Transcript_10759/g.14764  ORF Transcript_10759/g.14764 Transcript_10759/m.14764 type:complete len:186 (-) Transcript_10759:2700-3257(-)|eukprot:CAMPEP_0168554052 /NCGR_PEP_ID=MMETSP0413-20121227/7573_1 /TAXON_ID=136452 /ORGANISM="Filamoeba nolandi, Strain NC-AS-23-1" /LENGTH=185 /DNA_ID=CAMNT_0008584765 /DNA_START=41 /DNA_END=598 /DNA_ORIENTATION=-